MSTRPILLTLAIWASVGLPPVLEAQRAGSTALEPPTARIAVLASTLYNDQANLREASDSAMAGLATEVLRGRLATDLAAQLIPPALVDSLTDTPMARQAGGGVPCSAKVACAVAVARTAGARWVVMSKVSKTSNLIWLLSAQLIRVSTGEIVLDDSTELKGEPGAMIRIGVRGFADRVARTVRAGGRTTNFPNGEPALP